MVYNAHSRNTNLPDIRGKISFKKSSFFLVLGPEWGPKLKGILNDAVEVGRRRNGFTRFRSVDLLLYFSFKIFRLA